MFAGTSVGLVCCLTEDMFERALETHKARCECHTVGGKEHRVQEKCTRDRVWRWLPSMLLKRKNKTWPTVWTMIFDRAWMRVARDLQRLACAQEHGTTPRALLYFPSSPPC